MRDIFAEAMHDIRMFEGAADMLSALHAGGVKLALVSSNGEANVRHVLGPAADLIDHYACGSSLWGKSQKFAGVLRALRQSPARTLSVGDEIRDIDAARQSGLAAGSITFGYNARKALETHSPEYLFDDYYALRRAVLG
jgi:phosphoglycolate phosphatase